MEEAQHWNQRLLLIITHYSLSPQSPVLLFKGFQIYILQLWVGSPKFSCLCPHSLWAPRCPVALNLSHTHDIIPLPFFPVSKPSNFILVVNLTHTKSTQTYVAFMNSWREEHMENIWELQETDRRQGSRKTNARKQNGSLKRSYK